MSLHAHLSTSLDDYPKRLTNIRGICIDPSFAQSQNMGEPGVKQDVIPGHPPSHRKIAYERRRHPPPPPPKPKPRSAGFVFRSKRSNTADFSEFADVHQTDKLIRNFFDESRQENPAGESETLHTRHKILKTQIRKMLQMRPSTQVEADRPAYAISSTSMVLQQTPEGRRYGQIVTPHPFDMSLNVSTYNVNKMKRTSSAATQLNQKRSPPSQANEADVCSPPAVLPSEKESRRPPGSKYKHHASEAPDDDKTAEGDMIQRRSESKEPTTKSSIHRIFNSRQRREAVIPSESTVVATPKPSRETPVIPSPRKSVLNSELGLSRDWAESFKASQGAEIKASSIRDPNPEAEIAPVSRDFAGSGAGLFQRFRENRRRSRSPEKKTVQQSAVAGLSHDYAAHSYPSFRQRIEELRAANAQAGKPVPTPPVEAPKDLPPVPPTSPVTDNAENRPVLKPSPIIEHHSKPPSLASAESAAEDVQSDASSGVVSNAQSAIFMHGQIATGHYYPANARKPPMPGPPPNSSLPSLPEGQDNAVPSTPRVSESSPGTKLPTGSPGTIALPQKSPKRAEYRFLPTDCSPSKTRHSASPEQAKDNSAQEMSVPPIPTDLRIKRQGLSFPIPDHLPKSMSVNDLDQRQQRRIEKTAATKARDLARMRSQKATIEDIDTGTRETKGMEHHDGIAILPDVRDSYESKTFSTTHAPRVSESSLQSVAGSTATTKQRNNGSLPQRLSPIIVVAEQEPIPSLADTTSQESHFINIHSADGGLTRSRLSSDSNEESPRNHQTNGFHSNPSQASSPSLQLPADEMNGRPFSTHSVPTARAVSTRTPTPFTHSLLRQNSNRSSNRASVQDAQVSELEARLAAIEKKNVMLERAFLSVINTSAAYGAFDGGGETYAAYGDADSLRNGKAGDAGARNSGASASESLYAGLENLLVSHASEAGKRFSTGSAPS